MQKKKSRRAPKFRPLTERFDFLGDAVAPGDRRVLRSAIFEVTDRQTGIDRALKLWRKTGGAVDADLRELWLHEMRQLQRIMSYSGAREVIVDILEFVEDEDDFGVLLEGAGKPLSTSIPRVARNHWLRNLSAPRPRALFWRNIQRLVSALGIVHSQGLVHGSISLDCIMTESIEDADFQLSGFEWSLWLSADKADRAQAKVGSQSEAVRAKPYSFAEDWKALGRVAAGMLDSVVRPSGDVQNLGKVEPQIELTTSERVLLKRLVSPTYLDSLDVNSISRAIDDLIANVGRATATRSGAFILCFTPNSGLADAIYACSDGQIPMDEYFSQLDWVRADLDSGCTLLVKRSFDPNTDVLNLVSTSLLLTLVPLRQDGSPTWDVAICNKVEPRPEELRLADRDEHEVIQPIEIETSSRRAADLRASLGPNALDWSSFADARLSPSGQDSRDFIRLALLLSQVIEAVVRALEVYPVEILASTNEGGRRFVVVRAQPESDRDRISKRLGLNDAAAALKRLFEDDQRESEVGWRFTQAASLGANRKGDVEASFVDLAEHRGLQGYRFEVDDSLPQDAVIFLKQERDTGTENVISRRLRNIRALSTRVDLSELLEDPWRVRRSSRESIDFNDSSDTFFQDLDDPKKNALAGLWSTMPSFFVVGPPGVGKTHLATEVVRRKFMADGSTRMLLTAQGHDALDHLQEKVIDTLKDAGLDGEVIVVRSAVPDRRTTSDEDIHEAGRDYLRLLSESRMTRDAPMWLSDRVHALFQSSGRIQRSKESLDKDDRVALNAVSSLVLDAANVVITTTNSGDTERLVEAREQFDWVIVEEAAKATGPELAGSLMLSGRRLLIGDHHQLPPFESERLVKVLRDHSLVKEAIALAPQYVGALLRDGELAELEPIARDDEQLSLIIDHALRLFEPFRSFVMEDERRKRANESHRAISSVLTEQRRMDPAIAEVVSAAFYGDTLKTQDKRAQDSENLSPPFACLRPLPPSPIVIVDHKHVSTTGSGARVELASPRWHNRQEVQAVFDVLRHVRGPDSGKTPTLAVLSFYKAQVEKLSERIDSGIKQGDLDNLRGFRPALGPGKWVSTVDGFQGNEADLIILSLVRNNAGTGAGALGFLRDKRRMNVAMSRAKWKLVVVGSLSFLEEAVRGVNPDAAVHDLSFISVMIDKLRELEARTRRDGTPMASVIEPIALRGII